jgi:CHAT domain-containing protein/tetratricopeptide (TPR) repeat protein
MLSVQRPGLWAKRPHLSPIASGRYRGRCALGVDAVLSLCLFGCLALCPWIACSEELSDLEAKVESLRQQSKFVEAAGAAGELRRVAEARLGPQDPRTAEATYLLEWTCVKADLNDEVQNAHRRSLEVMAQTRGGESVRAADLLNQLGWAYYASDSSATEIYFKRALEVHERIEGTNGPGVAENLLNLGIFYHDLHDFATAKAQLERALVVNQICRGRDDVRNGSIYHFLGLANQCLWDLEVAEDCYRRALAVLKARDPQEEMVAAHCLNSYGQLCRILKRYTEAQQLHSRALRIIERVRGTDHFEVAYVLSSLGTLCEMTGDYAQGEQLFSRAFEINRRYWGPEHDKTLSVLRNWSYLEISAGNTNAALSLIDRARPGTEAALRNILSFAPSARRLAFKDYEDLIGPMATLGNGPALASMVLGYKGVVADSLLCDRRMALRSPDPQVRELVAEYSRARESLESLEIMAGGTGAARNDGARRFDKHCLGQRMEQIESDLARRNTAFDHSSKGFAATLRDVQADLPPGSCLAEQIRYRRYLGRGDWEVCYGVVLILPRGEPKWLELGSANELDKNLRLYQHCVRQTQQTSELVRSLHQLYEQLWAPLVRVLPAGSTNLIISPDGDLSFVSLATLLTPENRFLGETYSFSYVASGRDLVREVHPVASGSLQVWANPDFGAALPPESPVFPGLIASRAGMMRQLRNFSFGALPGAEWESRLLQQRAPELGFCEVHLHLGKAATESDLRRLEPPEALHLATHGFYFAPATAADAPSGSISNGRSGLALAGAQQTISAWTHGEVPPAESDGILTAEEVSTLNLQGTRLVVLSACETGMGQVISGEGVSGLRRAFLEAGAQNLLLTLWPIDDEKTAPLMLDFYREFHRLGQAPAALAEAQRSWLIRLRQESGAAEACRVAGPFILSFQGKPGS